jgi:hypothetical protein
MKPLNGCSEEASDAQSIDGQTGMQSPSVLLRDSLLQMTTVGGD